jgi:mannose-1-phosphate guanylyltransferase
MTFATIRPLRCGVVLAGGDGKRLQPLIRRLLGFDLPKQYVRFSGTRSMLEQTYGRAERLIDPERIFTVIAREHLKHAEVQRQISSRPPYSLVVQPINRETGPGLLLPLIHLFKRYPSSTVAVFPSDHFLLPEDLFVDYVQQAFEAVEQCPARIVFLGVEPEDPEPEYGYIIPGRESLDLNESALRVEAFLEKPGQAIASQFISQGALWNTMVMVFKPEVMLHLISLSSPKLYHSFQQIFQALGTCSEAAVIEEVYRRMEPMNFSKDLLEVSELYSRNQLSVIPMRGLFWSDWGSEGRIWSALEKLKSWDNPGGLSFESNGIQLSPAIVSRMEAVL